LDFFFFKDLNMKLTIRFVLTILICVVTLCDIAFSQNAKKVTYEDDMILVDGEPYAKMVTVYPEEGHSYTSISGLSGPELIQVRVKSSGHHGQGPNYYALKSYEYYFPELKGSNCLPLHGGKKQIATDVVEYNFIRGNQLNTNTAGLFLWGAPADSDELPIKLAADSILQGVRCIGKFQDEMVTDTILQKIRVITVYKNTEEQVAKASVSAKAPTTWTVQTMTDGKVSTLPYQSPGELQRLFRWLVEKDYL
jgi:hypothetical protein